MVNWTDYYFGITPKDEIFLTKGKLTANGTRRKDNKCGKGIVTEQVLKIVARMMRSKLDKEDKDRKVKRNYVGYDIKRVGKLVLIRPGYIFEVRKQPKIKVQPIQLENDEW